MYHDIPCNITLLNIPSKFPSRNSEEKRFSKRILRNALLSLTMYNGLTNASPYRHPDNIHLKIF